MIYPKVEAFYQDIDGRKQLLFIVHNLSTNIVLCIQTS